MAIITMVFVPTIFAYFYLLFSYRAHFWAKGLMGGNKKGIGHFTSPDKQPRGHGGRAGP